MHRDLLSIAIDKDSVGIIPVIANRSRLPRPRTISAHPGEIQAAARNVKVDLLAQQFSGKRTHGHRVEPRMKNCFAGARILDPMDGN